MQSNNNKFRIRTLSLSIGLALSSISLGVYAQSDEQSTDEKDVEKIQVIGTNIKGSTITGTLPVTELTAEDIATTGALDGDELLRAIPQIGSVGFATTRGGNTGVNAARGDVGSFNLRSVGEGNTLVLLNGRRMVNHPITQTSFGVPVVSANSNTLPVTGLSRVEVLRDGAGALYGADAVAGVVNYVTRQESEGGRLRVRYGSEAGTSRDDLTISGYNGFELNDGKSFWLISGNYAKKNGILANEKDYAANQDQRSRAPELFAGSTSLDNRSSLEPWADIHWLGLSSRIDDYIIRPVTFINNAGDQVTAESCGGGAIADGAGIIGDVCLEQRSSHDRALRPNRNEVRTLIPDIERFNLYSNFIHEINDDMEFYNESTYYHSTANRQWEQSAILSNGTFEVPADSYWNPFGPVTFADGRVNPNRLPGLDTSLVPEEGLAYNLRIRPTDVGPRQVEVLSKSFRFLNGLRGTWNDWDWDAGLLYSKAQTTDTASNRISSPLFLAQLSLDTPEAYNPFTGVNPAVPSSVIDLSPNPQSSIDPFLVSAVRKAETTLTMIDFKVSNPYVFSMPAGDAGIAMGLEWRKETLDEDNSDIFDGSRPFVEGNSDPVNLSSLEGSSVRPDVRGDRKVLSAYTELVMPLLRDKTFAHSVDMQLAARYEDFDDIGSIARPKLALSWYPVENLQFRGAISRGFRAPNLIQLRSPGTSITTGVDDFSENALDDNGNVVVSAETLADGGPGNGNYILLTTGNANLKAEKSENISVGFTYTPVDDLTLTFDWWEIETQGTVGVLSDENESRLDLVLRGQGSSNPRIIRDTPDDENPLGEIIQISREYKNLNTRTISGYDIEARYDFKTDIGKFDIKLNFARTLKFNQEPGGDALAIVEAGADPLVLGSDVGDIVGTARIPEKRGTMSLVWRSNDRKWTSRAFVKYVGEVLETSVRTTVDGEDVFLEVEPMTTINWSLTRRDVGVKELDLTFGINNITDEDPPLADTSFGYTGTLHSSRARYFYLAAGYKF